MLTSVTEHSKELRTDDLQQLHTLENLQEVLVQHTEYEYGRTLREENLEDEVRIENDFQTQTIIV